MLRCSFVYSPFHLVFRKIAKFVMHVLLEMKNIIMRSDKGMRPWHQWIWEDSSRSYRWASAKSLTPVGNGLLVEAALVDGQFRLAWMPFVGWMEGPSSNRLWSFVQQIN